jgi:arylsulfatase A-like enzyme
MTIQPPRNVSIENLPAGVDWVHGQSPHSPPAGDPQAFDGVSLMPVLLRKEPLPPRTLFWRAGDMKAVRQGPWKLVIEHGGAPWLYRLDNDLSEKRDLAAAEPQRLRELLAALEAWEGQFKK